MLTLQQILESDSISTLVAKLNANFQTVAASNGGPQGIRGAQGIPGLPGKVGPTGPTGVTGPTGNIVGIIPFACIPGTGPTAIGPSTTIVTPYGTVGPWPQSSWQWLQYYHVTGSDGDIFIDHANDGYWQYLNAPDVQGACDGLGGYTQGGYYSFQGTGAAYPFLGTTGGWAGAGWYFYPVPQSIDSSLVWVSDNTTYFPGPTAAGPYPQGPYEDPASSPLTVKNARLVTKYGTIWISSGSDENNPAFYEDSDLSTPTIGEWGHDPNQLGYANPGKTNSGVDRLLFKMSLDGLPYLSNITARGYTGVIGPDSGNPFPMTPNTDYPTDFTGTQMLGTPYWAKPVYDVSFEKFTPLLFLSERKLDITDPTLKFSSLGIYMFTDTADGSGLNDNQNKSIFLFSTRYAPDPINMFGPFPPPPNDNPYSMSSADTENWGEAVLDFRRVITSNQYVCSVPADMKLSSDYIAVDFSNHKYYDESNTDNVNNLDYAYRTYQGYISSINGKTLTGANSYASYWEYGLGDGTAGAAGGYGDTGGIHDLASGTGGMSTRKTWYGSSVLDSDPSVWTGSNTTIAENNLIRVAGMMERGRRFASFTDTHFLSELIFYTSHFTTSTSSLENGVGLTNDIISPNVNAHKSLPALYVSPYRNIGIGTFVGDTDAVNDLGPLEPAARLHVHVKENLRENDPTYTWQQVSPLVPSTPYDLLPGESFSAAAFSGDFGVASLQYNTDILIGSLRTQPLEYVNPWDSYGDVVNHMQAPHINDDTNYLRNAIRTESWKTAYINTLRFGAQPGVNYTSVTSAIGKGEIESFKNEFQIALHPITVESILADLRDSNRSITAVGIHNLYPRTRVHIFGKNLYNESEFGEELWTPGYTIAGGSATGIGGSYPFYGSAAQNSPSSNQVAIDYIGDSYRYPVGIYDYQYFTIGLTANTSTSSLAGFSPNAAVYPNRDALAPTRTSTPWTAALNNEAWPSTSANVPLNGSYRHGGTANAWWEPSSYIGFNLFRDESVADGNNNGDDKDTTRWVLGTNGDNGYSRGNNGAAAIISSPNGEMGIITIPRGRDGGWAYEQWEQRGLGTRDVLNQMKIVFDKNGNIAVGNAAGWDSDAYSSLQYFDDGTLRYTPITLKTTTPSVNALAGSGYTTGYYNNGLGTGSYGLITYGASYPETSSSSPAAAINRYATRREYIRMEVAAEKAWSRNGRSLVQNGYGYPINSTLTIASPTNYIEFTAPVTGITSWVITTDFEGRVINSQINFTGAGVTAGNFVAIAYPHPTEFEAGGPQSTFGFSAPPGALAAEWSGMNRDNVHTRDTMKISGLAATLFNTLDERGDANLRLNNFVYGEGFGVSGAGATGGALPGTGVSAGGYEGNATYQLVKQHRQQSPKLIFTFLEKNPTTGLRPGSGTEPYKKVNTVVQSAQNESPLREYFIPKSDNTGGTFMVFTDHMGSREKDSGIDRQLTSGTGYTGGNANGSTTGGVGTGTTGATGPIRRLKLVNVITAEVIYGRTAGAPATIQNTVDSFVGLSGGLLSRDNPKHLGYVSYYNKYALNLQNPPITDPSGTGSAFTSTTYGRFSTLGSYPATFNSSIGADGSFEFIDGTGTTAFNAYTTQCVDRNIDFYYSIFQGTTGNYSSDMGVVANEWPSKATEIRFKRINSEFVLVDFNITVEVNNPAINGAVPPAVKGEAFAKLANWIDCGAPRMTQSLTFIYNPNDDLDSYTSGNPVPRNGFTEDLYGAGEGPYFHMWSGYRNWLPGSAVVGGDINDSDYNDYAPRRGNVDTPFWKNVASDGVFNTWNGNILGAGLYSLGGSLESTSELAQYETSAYGNSSGASQSGIRNEYVNNILNSQLSYQLFGNIPTSGFVTKNLGFMAHLPTYIGTWGGQTMSRTKNFSWRMVPTRWENTTEPGPLLLGSTRVNNALALEIMFNEPIMHVDHAFNQENFGVTNPYKYLTLSGQGIIRYAATRQSI